MPVCLPLLLVLLDPTGAPPAPEPHPTALAALQALEAPALVLRSSASPATLLRFRSRQVILFADLPEAPSLLVAVTDQPAARERGTSLAGQTLTKPWLLTSFTGCAGFPDYDVPFLVCLDRRPDRIALTERGLELSYPADDTGWLAVLPLYGYWKPPQPTRDLAGEAGLPSRGVKPWLWRQAVPAEVVRRADQLTRFARAYPVGYTERYRVDLATDSITFRNDYDWLLVADDWGTEPQRFACLPATLGLALTAAGLPLELSAPLLDPDYPTSFGPLVGGVDVDRLDYTLKVLQYVNEQEELRLPTTPTPAQQALLDRIEQTMAGKFRRANEFVFDHGGKNNFCWNVVADMWYCRAVPLVSPAVAERARGSLQIYLRDHVLVPGEPYREFKGYQLLHGPGIGSWGTWGDAAKFSANALQTIWAYGAFTGDWALLRERWPFIRQLFCTPQQMDWLGVGRHSIAEIGDIAPPCAAYARLAAALDQPEEYLFGCYCYAKNLINHWVMATGGPYFYALQPYHYNEPMPADIRPTNMWGDTAGWQVDSPTWGKGEHQTNNRWVRFQDPDTGRFHRDHLAPWMRLELTEPNYLQRFEKYRTRDDAHIMSSLVRIMSLTLDAPYDELTAICDPARFGGFGPGLIAALYSYLRQTGGRTLVRLVPRTGASGWLDALPRLENSVQTPALRVVGARRPELSWFGFKPGGGKGERIRFGAVRAFDDEPGETETIRLSPVTEALRPRG